MHGPPWGQQPPRGGWGPPPPPRPSGWWGSPPPQRVPGVPPHGNAGALRLTAYGHNGQLRLDGGWLIINRKGVLAFIGHGMKGEKRIPLAHVTSVQFKEAGPVVNGYIQFGVLGGTESKAGILAATMDENTVMFRLSQQPAFQAIRQAVEHYLHQRIVAAATQPQASGNAEADVLEQLRKLGELRDAGILTDEEFASKKAELLGRI